MKIRSANKFDLPYVLAMLRKFREVTPIELVTDYSDEDHVNKLFHHILLGAGVALIAEEQEPIGMIIGINDSSIWDPNTKVLRELVYWVEPNHRGSSAGYRLLKQYNIEAEKLVEENKIQMYTMTKLANSPDLDFSRFGYKKAEEVWVGGI